MSNCRSCDAPILWARTPKGKMMPVNAVPSERGTVKVIGTQGDLRAATFGSLEALQLRETGTLLHVPHYVTCPDAAKWRKKR